MKTINIWIAFCTSTLGASVQWHPHPTEPNYRVIDGITDVIWQNERYNVSWERKRPSELTAADVVTTTFDDGLALQSHVMDIMNFGGFTRDVWPDGYMSPLTYDPLRVDFPHHNDTWWIGYREFDYQVPDDNERLVIAFESLGPVTAGDADFNGRFNSSDLVQAFGAGTYEQDTFATWTEGDWNGDNRFTTADMNLGMQEGYETMFAVVPEPSSLLIWATAFVVLQFADRRLSFFRK